MIRYNNILRPVHANTTPYNPPQPPAQNLGVATPQTTTGLTPMHPTDTLGLNVFYRPIQKPMFNAYMRHRGLTLCNLDKF